MSDPVLDFYDITLIRSGTQILANVNWRIEKGEHWAVIGLNGSGKTSLLQIIPGYLWPSTGKVSVLGEEFGRTNIPELRKRIGWVSTALAGWTNAKETALDIVLTGKTAAFGLYHPLSEADRNRAEALLDFMGCAHRMNHVYGTLSQGEQQKVLIARALMPKPEILILDEVCSGLDIAARERFLETVQRLGNKHEAPTLVFVTHHIEEIMPVFNKAMVLKNGSVHLAGDKKDVLTDEVLTDAKGMGLSVEEKDGRFWPQIRL